jgi:hypothetical protein
MTGRVDHSKRRAGDRVRRQGAQAVDDLGDILPKKMKPPKRRPSKATLRDELSQAEAKITRIVRCVCGHSASITLPPSRLRARLRCSKCGEVAR